MWPKNELTLQNRNRLTDVEKRRVAAGGGGEAWRGSLGLADAKYYLRDRESAHKESREDIRNSCLSDSKGRPPHFFLLVTIS